MKVVIFVDDIAARDFPGLENGQRRQSDLLALKETDKEEFYQAQLAEFVAINDYEVIRLHHRSGSEELGRQERAYNWTRSIAYSKTGGAESEPFNLAHSAFKENNPAPLLAYIRGEMDRDRAIVVLWNMALAFPEAQTHEVLESLCEDTEDLAQKIGGTDQKSKTAINYVREYFRLILERAPKGGVAPLEQELRELNIRAKNAYSEFRASVQGMFNRQT